MKFVKADLRESQNDFEDEYVRKIQKFVRHIKQDREMEEKYMLLEELLKDEREVGRKEGLEQGRSEGVFTGMSEVLQMFLSKFGTLPEELQKKINETTDLPEELQKKINETTDENVLKRWIEAASQVTSLEEFISKM